jgi:hypothetical protein
MNQDDDDLPPSEEELAEAEALARALERGTARGAVPEDALRAGHLLRYAKDGGALDPARRDAILDEALRHARVPAPKRPIRWSLLGALGLAAAGAVALVVTRQGAPAVAATLPAPSRALLGAELEATRSREGLAALGTEMTPYRAQMYAVLEERYRR